eukprot:6489544-Karenia_brevis.AAC.1
MSEPGYLHTKECRQRFYKILKDNGYEFKQKSSSASGPVEYEVIPPTELEQLEEAMMFLAHDEDLIANDRRAAAKAKPKAES